MPIYTNKPLAEKYWKENLRFEEFHSTSKENKIMREKIQDVIKNGVLVETPKTFNTLVQLVQAGTQSKWGHEISSRYERGQSIYGSETLQNGRNPYFARSHSKE
jgi:ribosomal protein S1